MAEPNPNVGRFMRLFTGLESAYGTGKGQWIKEPPKRKEYSAHLAGIGPGLGIAPLRPDNTVSFAAIDLDEPDFECARTLAELLPGPAFIEKSRSGNAHIFVFFREPIEAWVPRGIMREATAAVGKRTVEVFPKQDKLRIGMFGNYINLCYYGDQRPILFEGFEDTPLSLEAFLNTVYGTNMAEGEDSLNDGAAWRTRAHWLGVPSPEDREASGHKEFGTQSVLHRCAEYVLEHRDDNPVAEGHRAVVYFSLSKMFANCNQFNEEESLAMLGLINDSSPDPIPESEIKRIYFNAVRGQFTSTGCDDPLFSPYADPLCPIANPRR